MRHFLASEAGAVTVDWVTMTAVVVGLGLTSVAVVRAGQGSLAADIDSALSGASVAGLGMVNSTDSYDFENGDFSGWSMARLGYSAALGNFLGPFAGQDETLTHNIQLPDGATSATVTFDLLMLDSWDGIGPVSDFAQGGRGDGIAFQIDGVEIGHSWMTNGSAGTPTGTAVIGGTTFNYAMTRHSGGHLFEVGDGGGGWQDARWSVTLTATNPPPGGFQLGIDSTANQPIPDESFGIDNFRVTAATP